MLSIRNAMMIGIAALTAVGCQVKQPGKPVALNDTPLKVDGAMLKRDWEPSKAVYADGQVPANADRFHLEASDSTVDHWGELTETPIFLANSVIWPFTYIATPPGTWVDHPSVTTPPTYNGMPLTQNIPPYGLEGSSTR